MKAKLLAAILITGISFWIYRPDNGGVYDVGNFANFKDCGAVRAWVASVQPQSANLNAKMMQMLPNKFTAEPNPLWANGTVVPNQLIVSPACYYTNRVN